MALRAWALLSVLRCSPFAQIEVPVYDEEAPEEGLAYEQSREQDDDVETDYAGKSLHEEPRVTAWR